MFLGLTVDSAGTCRHIFLVPVTLSAYRMGMPCSYQFDTSFLYYFHTTVTKLLDIHSLEEKTFIWYEVLDISVHYGEEYIAQGTSVHIVLGLDQLKKVARDTLRTHPQ